MRLGSFLLFALPFVGYGQLALNPGNVWSHSFTSMTFLGTFVRFGGPWDIDTLSLSFTSFPMGSTLKYEMFENPSFTEPFQEGLITTGASTNIKALHGWQDTNGSIRLSMLTGGCVIASINYGMTRQSSVDPFNRTDNFSGYSSIGPLTSAPPKLLVRPLSNAVEVSWWTNGSAGYVLEGTNALRAGQWPAVTISPAVVNDRKVLMLNPTNELYLRLGK